MRSKKNKKKLMIAITLGLIATVSVSSMLNNQKAQIEATLAQQQAAALATMQSQAPANPADVLTSVVLAKSDIKSGEIITINKLERKEYKKSELPPSYFLNENFVLGKTAAQDVLTGKILTNDDILAAGENALSIPPGMRAITIPTGMIQGLASYVYIGSRIDLIAVKSPPEFIAQNVKIIALETAIDPSAAAATPATPAPAAPAPAAPGAAPAAPGAPAPGQTTDASQAPVATGVKNVSADKALGITVLVPVNIANRIISAMIDGKIQVITRGNNDNNIVKSSHRSYSRSSFSGKSISSISSVLPPPPSGTGKLPSLPGAIGGSTPIVEEKPKVRVEVIEASSTRQVEFDAPAKKTSSNLPSKEIKDLLKMSR